jgi:hypothetical protein
MAGGLAAIVHVTSPLKELPELYYGFVSGLIGAGCVGVVEWFKFVCRTNK